MCVCVRTYVRVCACVCLCECVSAAQLHQIALVTACTWQFQHSVTV